MKMVPYPKLSPLELQATEESLLKHEKLLIIRYHLTSNDHTNTVLLPPDIRVLIETSFVDINVNTFLRMVSHSCKLS